MGGLQENCEAALEQSHTWKLPLPNTLLLVELLLATGCGQRWGYSGAALRWLWGCHGQLWDTLMELLP